MGKNAKMNAMDTINSKLAECYVTIDGNRYNFMQAINLKAECEKTKTEVPILGRPAVGNKPGGLKFKGKAKFHLNTSIFVKVLKAYKDTGKDIYFDMQTVNEDPSSEAGRQEVILYDCNLDGGTIAAFDAEGSYLTDEISFTFEDYDLVEEFSRLDGMI